MLKRKAKHRQKHKRNKLLQNVVNWQLCLFLHALKTNMLKFMVVMTYISWDCAPFLYKNCTEKMELEWKIHENRRISWHKRELDNPTLQPSFLIVFLLCQPWWQWDLTVSPIHKKSHPKCFRMLAYLQN